MVATEKRAPADEVEDDYMTVARLRDLVAQYAPTAYVQLDAGLVQYDRICFGDSDQTEAGPSASLETGCNAVVFSAEKASTVADLLGLLDVLVQHDAHMAVTVDERLLKRAPTVTVRLNDTEPRLYRQTALNPYRYAALLSDRLPADVRASAPRFYHRLCARYGPAVVDGMALYRVDDHGWFSEATLRARFPALLGRANWQRLFEPCGVGALRRCVVDGAALTRAMLDDPQTMVTTLLDERARIAAADPVSAHAAPVPAAPTTTTATATATTSETGSAGQVPKPGLCMLGSAALTQAIPDVSRDNVATPSRHPEHPDECACGLSAAAPEPPTTPTAPVPAATTTPTLSLSGSASAGQPTPVPKPEQRPPDAGLQPPPPFTNRVPYNLAETWQSPPPVAYHLSDSVLETVRALRQNK